MKYPTKPDPAFLKLSRSEQKENLLKRMRENQTNLKGLINEAFRAGDMNEVAICRALLATAERQEREFANQSERAA